MISNKRGIKIVGLLVIVLLLLVGCSSKESDTFTMNVKDQMILKGSPRIVTTELSYINTDAKYQTEIYASVDAAGDFTSWHEGTVVLDRKGRILEHEISASNVINYTYDDKGLKTTKYIRNNELSSHYEEVMEDDRLIEYSIKEDGDERVITKAYELDSEGNIISLISYYSGEPDSFKTEYTYENGHLTGIKIISGEIVRSTYAMVYDELPSALTYSEKGYEDENYTFTYELDKKGNWIKCDKYKDEVLFVTVERTIEY